MKSNIFAVPHLYALGAAAMVFSLLVGCATHAPPKVDEARVKQFAGRGYLTDDHFNIARTLSSLDVGDETFDIAWTVPVSGKTLPVVIYLPGLGESRISGEKWRTAWAQAGYAVLSVQLLGADQKAWSSAAARRGDFDGLARERYGEAATGMRLKSLVALLAELQKGHASDEALLHRLDLSRIAIAGYDIGAYTAMRAAGELPNVNSEQVHLPMPIGAIIVLSPYADFSGESFSTRYQSIVAPVLSISGDADFDATGLVSSPFVRKAPFENMPSHNAYLLWLANGTHAMLSGSALAATGETVNAGADRRGESRGSRKSGSRRQGRHSSNYPDAEAGDDNHSGLVDRRSSPAASSTERAMDDSLIQGVTTAFLDVYLKQDPIAREWLQKDAGLWIGDLGELTRK